MLKILFVTCTLLSAIPIYADGPSYPGNPLLLDGALYLAERGLTRFDPSGTEVHWSSLGEIQVLEPVAAGDRVLVGSSRGLYALSAQEGQVLWNIPAGQTLYSPAVASGIAYFGGQDGRLRAVAISDGTPLWSRKLPGEWIYSPALSGNMLITGGQSHHLWGVDARSGETRWQFPLDQELVFSPVADGNGRVFISTFSGRLTALDASSGIPLWSHALPVAGHPPRVQQGRVYIPGLDTVLRTFAAGSGRLLWERRLDSRVSGSPLGLPGQLLLVTQDGRLLRLDAATGAILSDRALGGIPIAGAVIYEQRLIAPLISGRARRATARIDITPDNATD